jgi:hypothetical protein
LLVSTNGSPFTPFPSATVSPVTPWVMVSEEATGTLIPGPTFGVPAPLGSESVTTIATGVEGNVAVTWPAPDVTSQCVGSFIPTVSPVGSELPEAKAQV